jgi:DNA-binding NtrC family response regulator
MTQEAPALLVADDDPAVRAIVSRVADRMGFHVVACSDGAEAVARLAQTSIDLALLDLRMPELNGLEVLRTIRENDTRCEVALMSGEATIDSAVEAVKLGALDYLQKPLDLRRLEAILSSVREDTERRRRVRQHRGCEARQRTNLITGTVRRARGIILGSRPCRRFGITPLVHG